MNKEYDIRYYNIANRIILATIGLFTVSRVVNALILGEIRQGVIVGIACAAAILLTFAIQRLNKVLNSALFVPLFVYIIYITASFFMSSFTYFFSVYLAILCMGAVYNNLRRLLQFIIISAVINIALVYFRMPLSHLGIFAASSEIIVHSVLSFFSSAMIYMITRFASDKNGDSIKAEDTFRTLMETTSNKTVILDEFNHVTYISRAMSEFAGIVDTKAYIGKPFLDLFEDASVKLMLGEVIKTMGAFEDMREVKQDGNVYYFKIVSNKLLGTTKGRFLDITDVTQVVMAKMEAESASRMKSALFANMSHEIRTPMNAIIDMNELIRVDNLDAVQRAYFEDIKKMSKALLATINEALDFSKIEAGKLNLVPVHFNARLLFDSIYSLNRFLAESKGLELKKEFDSAIPETLYGDETYIRQIATNLLSNAIKYTQRGFVRFCMKKGACYGMQYLVIEVEDTGVGIEEDDIPKLFDNFRQFEDIKNSGLMGTGLGLAITKNLIDIMGGSIEVKSQCGRGSVFTAQIPLVKGDASKVKNDSDIPPFVTAQENAVSALVVDDMEVNRTDAYAFLGKYKIQPDLAKSGEEAIRFIEKKAKEGQPYDIVFMDYMMPEMDGVEIVKRMRDMGFAMPVIAFTASAFVGAREFLLNSGMDDFISKPVDARALNAVLLKWLPPEKIRVQNFQNEEKRPVGKGA
ncbi:MAG: response regulator [Treponema sp.]|nr:response regulator [Treponema sp.]